MERDKNLRYRASWVGLDPDPEFYEAYDFKYCPHKVREFHVANPDLPGPPKMLEKWIKAWEDGKDEYDDLDDSKVSTKAARTKFFRKYG